MVGSFFSAHRAEGAYRSRTALGLLLLFLILLLAPAKQLVSWTPNNNNILVEPLHSHTNRNANTNQPKDGTPLKVFLLAGQSNMVGMGSLKHLDLLVQDKNNTDNSNEYRQTLWNGTAYKERSDVFMIYQDHYGPLTVNRQYAGKNSFGPELMFGWTLGDALLDGGDDDDDEPRQPMLLLKTAWGGRDLAVDFRPPSAGTGPYGKHPAHYGWEYRQMISDIHTTLGNLSAYQIPGFAASNGYTLEGFVWFQGWNDMLDMRKCQEYGPNLAKFIRDVRLDLDAPDLPFIIGELGMHGPSPYGRGANRVLTLRAAQHSVTLRDEFLNSTHFVRTAPYAVLNETSYNGIYHYNGRADAYFKIGQAFGRGMLELMKKRQQRQQEQVRSLVSNLRKIKKMAWAE